LFCVLGVVLQTNLDVYVYIYVCVCVCVYLELLPLYIGGTYRWGTCSASKILLCTYPNIILIIIESLIY